MFVAAGFKSRLIRSSIRSSLADHSDVYVAVMGLTGAGRAHL
jgi:hypothetical protein